MATTIHMQVSLCVTVNGNHYWLVSWHVPVVSGLPLCFCVFLLRGYNRVPCFWPVWDSGQRNTQSSPGAVKIALKTLLSSVVILYQTFLICKWPFLCSFDATIYVQPYDVWQEKAIEIQPGFELGSFKWVF